MKHFITCGAAAAALSIGVAVASDKDDVSKNFDLDNFESIEISGVYDLEVNVGSDFSIEISGPRDEVDRVQASVSNGVLELDQKERRGGWGRKRHGVDATITLPMLKGVSVSGVVDGDIRNVDAETFKMNISGVGDVTITGKCGTFDANVSGVGDLDAKAMECSIVDVNVSGVGDASVFATDEVDARVSGMGDIDVYGSPKKVSKSDSMFAEVTIH